MMCGSSGPGCITATDSISSPQRRLRAVDEPFLATQSTDKQWIFATFSRDPGNLWTNPELTCQHADPSIELKAGTTRGYEVKTFLIKGTLEDVLRKVRDERAKIPRS